MDCYAIHEVDGPLNADLLDSMNALAPEIFPPLEARHYENGYWWIAYHKDVAVAFCGLVPFEPFAKIGYYKRCFVMPDHYGHGLQFRMMMVRELKARQLKWEMLVSECGENNHFSASNFRKSGFDRIEPEQRWGAPGSIYWAKVIA